MPNGKKKEERTVSWTMADGNIMAGQIIFEGYNTYRIRRVDGGICEIKKGKVKDATPEEILKACEFFTTVGQDVVDKNYFVGRK